MNVLRLPRVWVSPIASIYHGSARSITTLPLRGLLAPETAPNKFRRTEKSVSRSQTSFLRSLSTDTSPEVTPQTSAEAQESSKPRRNPKAAHLPYQIAKSKSGNLPVYEIHAAGRIKATVIRKVKGDQKALADDLKKALKLSDSQVRSNELMGRVEVAGERGKLVKEFLREQGFGEDFTPLTSSR